MKALQVLRVVPRDDEFLAKYNGASGEIFFDKNTNTIRVYDGLVVGGYELARADLSNVSNQAFIDRADELGLVLNTETYNNPPWIASLAYSKLTGAPQNIITANDTGTVTNNMLTGSIANAKLLNSSITIGNVNFALGQTKTTLTGLTSISATTVNAVTLNGSFAGNAGSATKLETARTINGVPFDGTADISVGLEGGIVVNANDLAGTTLASTVINSSLRTLGNLTGLTVNGNASVTGNTTIGGNATVSNTMTATTAVVSNGTMTSVGDITAQANVVVETTPTLPEHATNKRYTDARSIVMGIALS